MRMDHIPAIGAVMTPFPYVVQVDDSVLVARALMIEHDVRHLPVKDGKVRPDIVAKWVANAPLEMIEQYVSGLKAYYAIAIDIGTKDNLLGSNQKLHDAMVRLRIPHGYEEYDGDHTNKVRERIEKNVLPFFSKKLAAPTNPTSPGPGADRLSSR